jgi:hypothetical protein
VKISDIVNGISIKIDAEFPNATIYTEKIPQGFSEPCFVIKMINLEDIKRMKGRWLVRPMFNIMYFPSNNGGSTECYDVSLELQHALQEIELIDETIMLSTSSNTKIVDGEDGDVVAHNFMNFNFFLQDIKHEDFMESLQQYINKQRVNVIG